MKPVRRFSLLVWVLTLSTAFLTALAFRPSVAFPAPTPTPTVAACPNDVHRALPKQDSNFLTNLQTYLCSEAADQYVEQFHNFVFLGGYVPAPAPIAGLTLTPGAPTIATVNGHYTLEYGQITLADNSTCWMILDESTLGNIATFIRTSGTHYLADCRPIHSPKPALPAGTVWLMQVTTGGGNVNATTDLRSRVPWGKVAQLTSEIESTDRKIDLRYSLEDGCFYADTGVGWTALVDSRNMQMVTYVFGSHTPSNLAAGTGICDLVSFPGVQLGFLCAASYPSISGLTALISAQPASEGVVSVCYYNFGLVNWAGLSATDLRVSCWR